MLGKLRGNYFLVGRIWKNISKDNQDMDTESLKIGASVINLGINKE